MLKAGDLRILSIVNTRQKVDLFLVGVDLGRVGVNLSRVGVNLALESGISELQLLNFAVDRRNTIKVGILIDLTACQIVNCGLIRSNASIQSLNVVVNVHLDELACKHIDVGIERSICCRSSICHCRESTGDGDGENRLDHGLLHSSKFLDIKD